MRLDLHVIKSGDDEESVRETKLSISEPTLNGLPLGNPMHVGKDADGSHSAMNIRASGPRRGQEQPFPTLPQPHTKCALPAKHHISCAYDVVDRVAATVHVVELRLRHAIENDDGGKNKRLTFRNHLFQLEDASGRILNTPLQLRNLTVFCSVRVMGTCRRSTTGMPTTLSENCTRGISAGFRTVCPVGTCLSLDECFAMSASSKSPHRNTFTGWPQTMPPPTTD